MSPGGRDVPGPQRLNAGVVVQVTADELVAGSPGAGDGLGEQLPVASRVDEVAAQQVRHQALAQQDIVAELPGALDRLLPEGTSCLRLAGDEISIAARRERLDEQPLVAEPARELNRLLP